jgi:PBSX family phage terminase large subunit
MQYLIIENPRDSNAGFAPRGGGKVLWSCRDSEVMLSGPAETGKTFSSLMKLNALMWKYPGAQAAIVRKQYSTMPGSVLQTFEKKVLGIEKSDKSGPVQVYGGEKPQWYDYPNGSRVWVGGMDAPGKVLSSERDVIYVNQSEELTLEDWETLLTRTTGRAGNMPYSQIIGDCNPGPPAHWIKQRETLKLLESRHEDNPLLFDEQGKITPQGKRSLAVLDALTGVRLQRLRYGKWVAAEGQIYESYDVALHLKEPEEVPDMESYLWTVDFGYTHPFVWQNWGIDHDGRMYLLQEIYFTGRLVEDHAKQILKVATGKPSAIVCDHDAEDRATLEKHLGMRTIGAKKDVRPGIEAVQSRLKRAGDGKPRLFLVKGALIERDGKLREARKPTCTPEEIESYVWDEKKDMPVKEYDHGMDCLRYGVAHQDLRVKPEPAPRSSVVKKMYM